MADKDTLDEVIATARQYLAVLRRQNIDFKRAYLYGSFAKGTADRDSDIDLALVADEWLPDTFDAQVKLMMAATKVDLRIEPHPFKDRPVPAFVNNHQINGRSTELKG